MKVNQDITPPATAAGRRRPLLVTLLALLLGGTSVAALVEGLILGVRLLSSPGVLSGEATSNSQQIILTAVRTLLAAIILTAMGGLIARGLWARKNWARTALMLLLGMGLLYFLVDVLFDVSAEIFAGEKIMAFGAILDAVLKAIIRFVAGGALPAVILYGLFKLGAHFEESPEQRNFIDRSIRYLLLATALSAILIVFLIILFTLVEAWESVAEIGLSDMLLGTVWRPGSIIGEKGQYGLVPMIVGSILSTFGAVLLGVPLSIGTAILLAEVAPPLVREIVRPAVELLAGIPSVVYGLFGMVVLAPLIRKIVIPYNTGFNLLNASIVLAVMIIPTVTNIAEDAIRAVPRQYKEGSLALGATHFQTILRVILPAARSGLVAAVILGIGRALGETMAMIMVIGNSIAIPIPLNDNPLTLFLSSARTLTGNIAVEINYAAGPHRSALFFTGILLFLMILLVNSVARFLMKERLSS